MKPATLILALILPLESRADLPAEASPVLGILRDAIENPPANPGVAPDYVCLSVVDRQSFSLSGELHADVTGDSVRKRELTIQSSSGRKSRTDTRYIPATKSPDEFRDLLADAINNHLQSRLLEPAERASLVPPLADIDVSPVPELTDGRPAWRSTLRRILERFATHPSIIDASVSFTATRETRWLANMAGGLLQGSIPTVQLAISATCRPQSGLDFTRTLTFFKREPAELPDDTVLARLDALLNEMEALKAAPVITTFRGPVMLSGRAASVMYTSSLLHRTAASPPLPSTLRIFDDPALEVWHGVPLRGYAPFDGEGRRAERMPVPIVDGKPPHAVAAHGTLIFQVESPVSPERLIAQFIEVLKQRGAAFGLRIADAAPAPASRSHPGTPMLTPMLAYRVWSDGREEPVRIEGTLTAAPAGVLVADDEPEIGSDSVPPSVAPGLLLEEATVQPFPRPQ